jgi:ClpX C4-type zinc finger
MSESMFKKKRHTGPANASQPVLRCSFCDKDEHQVEKLIAGPKVFICNECIEVCLDIINDDPRFAKAQALRDEKPANGLADTPGSGSAVTCAMCRTPIIVSRGLLIPSRGVRLCFGCIGEIDDAIADSGEPEP